MEDRSLENLEAGVDRLLDAFGKLKAENRELREKLAGMESKKILVRERLDSLIDSTRPNRLHFSPLVLTDDTRNRASNCPCLPTEPRSTLMASTKPVTRA